MLVSDHLDVRGKANGLYCRWDERPIFGKQTDFCCPACGKAFHNSRILRPQDRKIKRELACLDALSIDQRRQRLGVYWKKYTKLPCSHYEGARHSFCTQIVEVADRSAAQDLMRHADGRSTDRYIHNRTEYLRDVTEKRGKVSEIKKRKG
jgi:integrase